MMVEYFLLKSISQEIAEYFSAFILLSITRIDTRTFGDAHTVHFRLLTS